VDEDLTGIVVVGAFGAWVVVEAFVETVVVAAFVGIVELVPPALLPAGKEDAVPVDAEGVAGAAAGVPA
jgi:hypothetical protein